MARNAPGSIPGSKRFGGTVILGLFFGFSNVTVCAVHLKAGRNRKKTTGTSSKNARFPSGTQAFRGAKDRPTYRRVLFAKQNYRDVPVPVRCVLPWFILKILVDTAAFSPSCDPPHPMGRLETKCGGCIWPWWFVFVCGLAGCR